MLWRQALTEYNKINNQYVIPRKGTPQYDEVKKIEERLKASGQAPAPAPAPKTTKAKTTKTKKGKGIKEGFIKIVQKVNETIDNNIESVPDDIQLQPTEYHAKKNRTKEWENNETKL